ncbi:MAG: hypothetical protein J7497_10135, partial [Chitinophagaceae bacterium]|nr:hypothetical protein [Chitinophagaceae bacterium]
FDLEWYVKNNIPLHLEHFVKRSIQSGDWNKENMTTEEFMHMLIHKIDHVSMDDIKEDIVRFIPDDNPLEIWSRDYFKELAKHIRFVNNKVIVPGN